MNQVVCTDYRDSTAGEIMPGEWIVDRVRRVRRVASIRFIESNHWMNTDGRYDRVEFTYEADPFRGPLTEERFVNVPTVVATPLMD